MAEGPSVEFLRAEYLAVGCTPAAGSRASAALGDGLRTLFLVACDGRELAAYDSAGRLHRLKRAELMLRAVYNESGKKCRYKLDGESGHLHILVESPEMPQVESVGEVWEDCGPWEIFDPARAGEVSEALQSIPGKKEPGGMGPIALETVF